MADPVIGNVSGYWFLIISTTNLDSGYNTSHALHILPKVIPPPTEACRIKLMVRPSVPSVHFCIFLISFRYIFCLCLWRLSPIADTPPVDNFLRRQRRRPLPAAPTHPPFFLHLQPPRSLYPPPNPLPLPLPNPDHSPSDLRIHNPRKRCRKRKELHPTLSSANKTIPRRSNCRWKGVKCSSGRFMGCFCGVC